MESYLVRIKPNSELNPGIDIYIDEGVLKPISNIYYKYLLNWRDVQFRVKDAYTSYLVMGDNEVEFIKVTTNKSLWFRYIYFEPENNCMNFADKHYDRLANNRTKKDEEELLEISSMTFKKLLEFTMIIDHCANRELLDIFNNVDYDVAV